MATAETQFKGAQVAKPKHDKAVVAAIDFGTTYSGYAFSFRSDPFKILLNQVWYAGETTRLVSLKTSTCVLVNKNKEFDSFGFQAENKYATLAENNQHEDWYFFQHFKMMLYNEKNLTKATVIEDISGKTMPAFTIFTMAISYLKKQLTDKITDGTTEIINEEDVYFVLTVPAIWNESAKQFMEEAAIEAGIRKKNLELALEPEAASIFCQLNPTQIFEEKGTNLEAGTQYMVVDLGGGTVDITCHEKQIDNTLKEICKASGGAFGGLKVNQNFMNFLIKIFGQSVMDRFRKEQTADFIELSRAFEIKKRDISPSKEGFEIIRMPASFRELYESTPNQKVQAAIEKAGFVGRVSWTSDKLRIEADIIKEFFSDSVDSTVLQIQTLLKEKRITNLSRILLVGGFSECKLVQDAVKTKLAEIPITIPFEAGLTVLKGAVCYGQRPSISSRILRYTYGVVKYMQFDPSKHPLSGKYEDEDGVIRCKDCFDIIKPINSSVYTGETVKKESAPFSRKDNHQTFKLFTSNVENPLLISEEGCKQIGQLIVYLPEYTGKKRLTKETYIFGETQLKVEAIGSEGGEKYETYLNLL